MLRYQSSRQLSVNVLQVSCPQGKIGLAQLPMPRVLQIAVDRVCAEGVPDFCRTEG